MKPSVLPIILLCLTLSVGHAEEASKQFYFLGGGGEPQGDTTIFDGEVKRVGSFINSSGWNSTVSFNGGHAKTEDLIKSKMGKAKIHREKLQCTYG